MLFVLVEPVFNNELVVTESQCQAAATGYRPYRQHSLMFAALSVFHNSIYIVAGFCCSALWRFQNSSCVAAWSALILVQINYSIYTDDSVVIAHAGPRWFGHGGRICQAKVIAWFMSLLLMT